MQYINITLLDFKTNMQLSNNLMQIQVQIN